MDSDDINAVARLVADYAAMQGRENAWSSGLRARAERAGLDVDSSPEFVSNECSGAYDFLDSMSGSDLVSIGGWDGDLDESDEAAIRRDAIVRLDETYAHVPEFFAAIISDEAEPFVSELKDQAPRKALIEVAGQVRQSLKAKWPEWFPEPDLIKASIEKSVDFKRYVASQKQIKKAEESAKAPDYYKIGVERELALARHEDRQPRSMTSTEYVQLGMKRETAWRKFAAKK